MQSYASVSVIPRANSVVKARRRIAARPLSACGPVALRGNAIASLCAQPLTRRLRNRLQPLRASAAAGGEGPDITQANEVANQDALIDQLLAARNDDEFARLVAEK